MDCGLSRVDASAHDKIIMDTGDNVFLEIFGMQGNGNRNGDCI